MAPAANPSRIDKYVIFGFGIKKAIRLPIPVESPANVVRIKAVVTVSMLFHLIMQLCCVLGCQWLLPTKIV